MAMSETMKPSIQAALAQVQSVMQVPKNSYNAFGKYPYRTAEAILRSAKLPCKEHGIILTLSEEVQNIGERYYILSTATATLIADPADVINDSYSGSRAARWHRRCPAHWRGCELCEKVCALWSACHRRWTGRPRCN